MTLTAHVTPVAPGAGSPNGTVSFYDKKNELIGTAAVVNGEATLTVKRRAYTMDVVYSGSQNYAGARLDNVKVLPNQ